MTHIFLNQKILDSEALTQIKVGFDLDPRTTRTVRVRCDEMHAHDYSCLDFDNRISTIYLRLLEEIDRYKGLLRDIEEN